MDDINPDCHYAAITHYYAQQRSRTRFLRCVGSLNGLHQRREVIPLSRQLVNLPFAPIRAHRLVPEHSSIAIASAPLPIAVNLIRLLIPALLMAFAVKFRRGVTFRFPRFSLAGFYRPCGACLPASSADLRHRLIASFCRHSISSVSDRHYHRGRNSFTSTARTQSPISFTKTIDAVSRLNAENPENIAINTDRQMRAEQHSSRKGKNSIASPPCLPQDAVSLYCLRS